MSRLRPPSRPKVPIATSRLVLPILTVLILALAAPTLAAQAGSGGRFALVIGNNEYEGLSPLKNPANDAADMAAALKRLGFVVDLRLNADLAQMEEGAVLLSQRLAADRNSLGLFYYAGHGVQSGGINYLIPSRTAIAAEAFLKTKALAAQSLLDLMQGAGNSLNLVFLDACRDNPYSWKRSGTRGLSVVGSQPPGSVIVYATSAGSTAGEGTGRNGVFTSELLKHIETPGLDLDTILNRTAQGVLRATGNAQNPGVYKQFFETAYLTSSVPPAAAPAVSPYKVAFVYTGPPGDLGWTYEHDQGRMAVGAEFGDKVKTVYIENVPEGPDATRIIRQYAQDGYDMIFATIFGYMDPMVEVAKEFPKVKFEHCSGYKTADNMSTYFGRIYQPRYLSGIVAGKMTKSNIIGYVAAFPVPEVIRDINSFTLGIRSVNPKAQVRVVWTNTWYDPVKEREAAVALLDAGADIIAQSQDTVEPQKAAKERGKLSIGYGSDMRAFVGDSVLTSPVWNWGVYYIETIRNAMSGTWKRHKYWEGLKAGVVRLADFSPLVPRNVKDLVKAAEKKILDGTWDVFLGPIKDQTGAVKVAAGSKMTDAEMLSFDWFVEGVVGKVK